MASSTFIRSLYTKCRVHGSGEAQVSISDIEIFSLICLSIQDLNWDYSEFNIEPIDFPHLSYFDIPLGWFSNHANNRGKPEDILNTLSKCCQKNEDFSLYIENLSALHRRRVKYRKILSQQPIPTMEQIGPRILLEYGGCDPNLLALWLTWRKWIYDIDNRSAQETGYVFEPILASCLGGESVSASNSPVKRIDQNGNPTNKGRQIDCLSADNNTAYELKLRVTIAASGQGRFSEELSFPVECLAAGYRPVLLVLDPTPSPKLKKLSEKFLACKGGFYQGEAAWKYMESQAGEVMSRFIGRYIKPIIEETRLFDLSALKKISLEWDKSFIKISDEYNQYEIPRE